VAHKVTSRCHEQRNRKQAKSEHLLLASRSAASRRSADDGDVMPASAAGIQTRRPESEPETWRTRLSLPTLLRRRAATLCFVCFRRRPPRNFRVSWNRQEIQYNNTMHEKKSKENMQNCHRDRVI